MIEAIQFTGAMNGRNIYGIPFPQLDLKKQGNPPDKPNPEK